MNKNKSKKHKALFIILRTILLIFSILFLCSKEFRFNVAVRFIVLTNVNPFYERYNHVSIWDDNIRITKKMFTDENKSYKAALRSALVINEKIYKLQRSDFWCKDIRAVYIDSDTYMGGLASISVETGNGSYVRGPDVVYGTEGKRAIIRYQELELTKECEKIVSEYDDYEFSRE